MPSSSKRSSRRNSTQPDWIYIKPNNIHMYITQFLKENPKSDFDNFYELMVVQNYSFISITSKQMEITVAELKRNFSTKMTPSH